MAYWICEKCKLYFPAKSEHKINMKCKCGGKLQWHEKIPQNVEEEPDFYYQEISPFMQNLIKGYESALSRIILNCVDEVYFPVSTKITMLILQGNPTPFIIKHHLNELETYSMLSNFNQKNLLSMFESLINLNLLKKEHKSRYSHKPVSNLTDEGLNYVSALKITDEGRVFLNNGKNISLGFLDKLDILKG